MTVHICRLHRALFVPIKTIVLSASEEVANYSCKRHQEPIIVHTLPLLIRTGVRRQAAAEKTRAVILPVHRARSL